ncbi:MAG TPA: sugar phosphate isomerase/epimerase [Capsulimonadaceae bacterium]|nr:sugar phosphate isomerase/epimerase [Capsulimonadaceae bacterium]
MAKLNARIGLQPLTFKGVDFPTVCQKAKEAGYGGIECGVGGWLDKLGELQKILDDNGLKCASTYTTVHPFDKEKAAADADSIVRIGEGLKKLGASECVVAAAFVREKPSSESHAKEVVQAYGETLNKVGDRLNRIGVKAVIHNHIHTLLERPEEIDWFSEATDPTKVYWGFDSAQLSAGGADAVEYFRRYADRVKYTHLKDRKIGHETYGNFAELGTGFIHFPSILQVLADAGYNGWLIAELDESKTTPFESVKHNCDYLKGLLK